MQFKHKSDAIKALRKLKRRIGMAGSIGFKARVEFLKIVFLNHLKLKLTSYALFDEHNIGERDYDTCFEMHDGDEVIHQIISDAKENERLFQTLSSQIGDAAWNEWLNVFDRVSQNDKQMALI